MSGEVPLPRAAAQLAHRVPVPLIFGKHEPCPTCGGPLWREERPPMPRCQVCALHWIPVDTQTGGQRLHGSTVPDEWRGREEEANRWEVDAANLRWLMLITSDGNDLISEEARRRPRAILEPGPEPGPEAHELLNIAWRAGAPVIGHTSREVEETKARICPPRSRRDTRRLVGHLGGIPYYEDSALGDDGMHGYILTRAPR